MRLEEIEKWYEHIENTIPKNIPPDEIIILGYAFLAEPIQYAAFLIWLCEKKVSSRAIIDSDLLHQFFSQHIIDIAVLQETYQFIREKKSVITFLKYASTIHYGQKTCYPEHNVLGIQCKNALLRSYESPSQAKQISHDVVWLTPEIALPLFSLFGWTFIRALDLNVDTHAAVVASILDSTQHNLLLSELSKNIFDEIADELKIEKLFFLIASRTTPEILTSHIVQEPFFLHVVCFKSLSNFQEKTIIDAIKKLCEESHYHVAAHLPLLERLYFFIRVAVHQRKIGEWIPRFFRDRKNIDETLNHLLKLIFNLMIQFDDVGNPALFTAIKDDLLPYAKHYFTKSIGNIKKAIADFFVQDGGYINVIMKRSEQLRATNFLFSVYPEFRMTIHYPNTIHDLAITVLNEALILKKSITQTVEKMREDQDFLQNLDESEYPPYLCGLRGDDFPDNNFALYLELLYESRNNLALLNYLLNFKNNEGETLLHLVAKSGSYQLFLAYFKLFEETFFHDDMQTLLNAKNKNGKLAHCNDFLSESLQINALLARKRRTVCSKLNNENNVTEKRNRSPSPC